MRKEHLPEPSGGEMYRAGRPSPGARLMAAGGLVQKGRPVADIGCDHGKLAVWLVMAGVAPSVIAVDTRPIPLGRAKALAKQCDVERHVDCRLGDGLGPLLPGEAGEIIVAGLSGETIVGILEKAPWPWAGDEHLVLQPTSRAPLLRRWLCKNGFAIREERPVLERKRAYTNLSVFPGAARFTPDALFCEVGLLPEAGGEAAKLLLQNRLTDLRNQLLAPPAGRGALQELTDEVERCLKLLK